MAVGLAAAAAVCFVVAAAVGPDDPSFWLRLTYLLAVCAGVFLLIGALAWAARRRIEQLLADRLVDLASPSLIRAMPPRTVLESLLPWIYGDTRGHEDVLAGVLGGAGRDLDGGDTAVSRNTTAHFRLWTVDDGICANEAEWTHELTGVRQSHKFVVFATHDERILAAIATERRFPLFESFQVQEEDELDDFVRRVRDDVRLGITYRDTSGRIHRIAPRAVDGELVPLRRFDQYVGLPDDVDRKDLCIVQFDLWDLVHDDHVPRTIEELTVRVRGTPGADMGWYVWSVPHPCFVRDISFDVVDLAPPAGRYEFMIVRSALRNTVAAPSAWMVLDEPLLQNVDSWMLPGHGVTLLWRLAPDPA
ncbi:hypothetical protein ACQEVB_05700 [Pseudonocardia sp. CA-107938]|uniref:hypothetical protein n=1 Tax=Pseudonocardia sp. CA-107938 TaxID=3240021 RepID=UPI003D94D29F